MKRGEWVVARVERLSSQGDGVAQVHDRQVVIPRTVPGDEVRAWIKRKRRGCFEAEVAEFLGCSIQRQTPPCQHFGICGGCRWQDIPYTEQLQFKQQMVEDALAVNGRQIACIRPIIRSPEPLFYRNKMEFSFGLDRDGKLQLGLHVRARFDRLFDVEACHLQSELSNRILRVVRRGAIAAGIPVYDLKSHQGLLRFLVIRESKKKAQVMVRLVVAEYPQEAVDRLARQLLQEVPEITTLVIALHQGRGQAALGQEEFVLKGSGWIVEECAGLEFQISPRSYFQTNSLQAGNLYQTIRDLAGDLKDAKVLDLYCGTGGIGIHLARWAQTVLGVEVVAEAVEDARRNAAINGLQNAEFIAGAAEDVLPTWQAERADIDLVVVDPPRAGLHRRVLGALARLRPPVIVYVSCNPASLANDLESLMGYCVEVVQPVDMFPQTPHCEVVVRMVRQQATPAGL